jgi:predicted dinucleotide-binding enzyme
MNIGIIGTGHIGGTLTRRFTKLGHNVKMANSRGPASLTDLAGETGAQAVDIGDAVKGVDVVVVTIPMKAVRDLPKDLFKDASPELVVVDTCNYYPQQRDGKIAEIEDTGMPESRYVESQIGRPVIKAFNNIYAQHLMDKGLPVDVKDRIALPVSGDDGGKKDVVMALINQLGFTPVDNGSIEESWRQQPGQPVYAKDYAEDHLRRALSEAHHNRSPEWMAA